MGYHTEFEGSFALNRRLSPEHAAYLQKFSETRRMRRSESILINKPDPIRNAVNLPIGKDGEYFVAGIESLFQYGDDSVIELNSPPEGQPGLWCQWVPGEEGNVIEWDGGEKFYEFVEWLEYIIERFLKPWGYTLDGEVRWYGEDRDDIGIIIVENNIITIKNGRITYDD